MSRGPVSDHKLRTLTELLAPKLPSLMDIATEIEVQDRVSEVEQDRLRALESAELRGFEMGTKEAEAKARDKIRVAEEGVKSKYSEEIERMSAASECLLSAERALTLQISGLEAKFGEILIEATFAAVSRICARAAQNRMLVLDLCREAMEEYTIRPVLLRVHASDLASIAPVLSGSQVRIEADSTLERGQCRLETAKGMFEAGIGHRLDALKSAFTEAISSGPAR